MFIEIKYNNYSRVLRMKRIIVDRFEMLEATEAVIENGKRRYIERNIESIEIIDLERN